MRRGQQGITLIGFIMILAVLGCFAYVGMKIIPMYNEYYAICKALAATAKDPGITNADNFTVQDKISRHFETSYISSIQPKDVKVKRLPDGNMTFSAEYQAKSQIGNTQLYLVGQFSDTESTSPTAGKGATP